MSYTDSPPKYKTTLKPKITPFFCHEWQRVSHWEIVISSSLEELASLSSSSSASSSSLVEAFGEGDEEGAKPPRRACRCAIRLTWVFTWHISLVKESRQVSMHWHCTMMALRVTPPTVEVEGAEKEGIAEAVGSVVSTCSCFDWSWASLHRTEPTLMASMMVKQGELGMWMEKWWRIRMIAEGKISL